MQWVMPMAGKGTRTKLLGEFKPFIKIDGRMMIEWFIRSIERNISIGDFLVFITTIEYNRSYNFVEEISMVLEKVLAKKNIRQKVVLVKQTPPGPAATTYYANKYIDSTAITVINCDQWIDFSLPKTIENFSFYLPVYCNFHSNSSYVGISNGKVTEVVEKKNISNIASAGVYSVSDGKKLMEAIEEQFENKSISEYFVGPALNILLENGFTGYPIEIRAKYDLGNVNGIENFCRVISK